MLHKVLLKSLLEVHFGCKLVVLPSFYKDLPLPSTLSRCITVVLLHSENVLAVILINRSICSIIILAMVIIQNVLQLVFH